MSGLPDLHGLTQNERELFDHFLVIISIFPVVTMGIIGMVGMYMTNKGRIEAATAMAKRTTMGKRFFSFVDAHRPVFKGRPTTNVTVTSSTTTYQSCIEVAQDMDRGSNELLDVFRWLAGCNLKWEEKVAISKVFEKFGLITMEDLYDTSVEELKSVVLVDLPDTSQNTLVAHWQKTISGQALITRM